MCRSLLAAVAQGFRPAPAAAIGTSLTPESVLTTLMAGNQRFVEHHEQHPHLSSARMQAIAQAQHPIATVLSCADSRVPAELLFDTGLGDIFNVRVAGNIVTPEVLGSLEYAVELLGTPVLMVLGHERCGAVTAAVQNESVPGHIGDFLDEIQPAVAQVKDMPGDVIDNAVKANVKLQMAQLLKQSNLIQTRQSSGAVQIVGARYDLDSGVVELL